MSDCEQFKKLSYDKRKDFLVKNRICFKCVSSDKHVSKDCERDKLNVKYASRSTPLYCMTQPDTLRKSQNKPIVPVLKFCGPGQPACSCVRIVLLEVFQQENPSEKVLTYAVLDDQSSDVFLTDTLLEQLKIEGQEVDLKINTITGTNSVRTRKVNGLHIQDIDHRHKPLKRGLCQWSMSW